MRNKKKSTLSDIVGYSYVHDHLFSLDELKKYRQSYETACGIYFLFHRNKLVYVGSSTNCFARFASHENDKKFDEYFIIDTSKLSRKEMYELESKYISKFTPPLNNCHHKMGNWEWVRKMDRDRKERQKKLKAYVQKMDGVAIERT